MQDATFNAQIKSAALTARDEDDKTIRRVRFALASTFTLELAEWLGPVAMNQRDLLVNGDLKSFKVPIDAYHAKMALAGSAGNCTADVDGLVVLASVRKPKGEDAEQTEIITLTFESFPHAALLTFLAAHVHEYVSCDFKRSQLSVQDLLDDKGSP